MFVLWSFGWAKGIRLALESTGLYFLGYFTALLGISILQLFNAHWHLSSEVFAVVFNLHLLHLTTGAGAAGLYILKKINRGDREERSIWMLASLASLLALISLDILLRLDTNALFYRF
jgi:hypothetical protein